MDVLSREERQRLELIDAIAERIAFVKQSADRIGNVWALKIIAENVARLDELDQLDGFLPPQIRPDLMICWREAELVLSALMAFTGKEVCDVSTETVSLMKKLRGHVVQIAVDRKKVSTDPQNNPQ